MPDISHETFNGTFPFPPHFAAIKGHRMHYVDEGRGSPVVCIHGEPTWGYLYRNFIPPLSKTNRVIVPDHLGFGKSDKPYDGEYKLAWHADNLTRLMLDLDLRDITLVVHDWGGPIGLGFAVDHPERVKALVILNTFCMVIPEGTKIWTSKLEASGLIKQLVLGANILVECLPETIRRKEVVTETFMEAYRAPFPHYLTRLGVLAFPRDIPVGQSHPSAPVIQAIQDKLPLLKDKPAAIIWGMKDWVIPPALIPFWKDCFPRAEVHEIAEAGHFLQEDEPQAVVRIIQKFLTHSAAPNSTPQDKGKKRRSGSILSKPPQSDRT